MPQTFEKTAHLALRQVLRLHMMGSDTRGMGRFVDVIMGMCVTQTPVLCHIAIMEGKGRN